jgi:arginase
MKTVSVIGAASGWGAKIRETAQGPEQLIESGIIDKIKATGASADLTAMVYAAKGEGASITPAEALPYVADHANRLAQAVAGAIKNDTLPLVLGGDHAIAAGTWSGVTTALEAEGNFGLIWVDAHMDAHVPETSPSGAYHGMPVASLMGYGADEMRHILSDKAKISPEHVAMIGMRSYEEGEEALLKKLGVRVFYMDDVRSRGFAAVWDEAVAIASCDTAGFGVSIDLDAFDPSEAPGVGSPEVGGLSFAEVMPCMKGLAHNLHLKTIEMTEFNPTRDQKGMTADLAANLLLSFFKQAEGKSHDEQNNPKGRHLLCA